MVIDSYCDHYDKITRWFQDFILCVDDALLWN